MAPRYNPGTGLWEATKPDEEDGSSYGPIGSLIRGGPSPFIQRLINKEAYDQAVLKYMASELVDRKEAQGNMDAYFDNPNDWAFQKIREKKGGFKKDYANANTDPKSLVLIGTWTGVLIWFFSDLIGGLTDGKYTNVVETVNKISEDPSILDKMSFP